MTTDKPVIQRERDPVCGMNVRIDVAIKDGLVADYENHTYYFCRAGCRDEFRANPAAFITSHGHAGEALHAATPDIDDGMRRWYEACSCCLSDAYPEIKAALDSERTANQEPMADPGICEVADAAEVETAKV